MTKKFISILSVSVLALSLTACGQSKPEVVPSSTPEVSSPVETATPTPEVTEAPETTPEVTPEVTPESSEDAGEAVTPAPSEKPEEEGKPSAEPKPSEKPSAKPTQKPAATKTPAPTKAPTKTPQPTKAPTPAPAETSMSCQSIFDKITSGVEVPAMMPMDEQMLKDFYGIDTSILEDFSASLPLMSAHITEIGVFKVKDEANVNAVLDGINKRANDVGSRLYPSLQEAFDARVILTKGKYVLFVMDNASAEIKANFEALMK